MTFEDFLREKIIQSECIFGTLKHLNPEQWCELAEEWHLQEQERATPSLARLHELWFKSTGKEVSLEIDKFCKSIRDLCVGKGK
jgi:hypothetical protein